MEQSVGTLRACTLVLRLLRRKENVGSACAKETPSTSCFRRDVELLMLESYQKILKICCTPSARGWPTFTVAYVKGEGRQGIRGEIPWTPIRTDVPGMGLLIAAVVGAM